jgi:ankyrin repeat protein
VNAQNKYGDTALALAIERDANDCITMLIESGADIHSLNDTQLKKLIKNNIYTVDILRNTAFNRRKHALLFYKTHYLDNYC